MSGAGVQGSSVLVSALALRVCILSVGLVREELGRKASYVKLAGILAFRVLAADESQASEAAGLLNVLLAWQVYVRLRLTLEELLICEKLATATEACEIFQIGLA